MESSPSDIARVLCSELNAGDALSLTSGSDTILLQPVSGSCVENFDNRNTGNFITPSPTSTGGIRLKNLQMSYKTKAQISVNAPVSDQTRNNVAIVESRTTQSMEPESQRSSSDDKLTIVIYALIGVVILLIIVVVALTICCCCVKDR